MGQPDCFVLLDIDGVLIPFGPDLDIDPGSPKHGKFPMHILANLEKIVRETNARIVLSTTWRSVPDAIAEIAEAFESFGGALATAAHTTELKDLRFITDPLLHNVRQWECVDWVQRVAPSNSIHVRKWVALDDDQSIRDDVRYASLMREGGGHFVVTESAEGLTEERAVEAIRILMQ